MGISQQPRWAISRRLVVRILAGALITSTGLVVSAIHPPATVAATSPVLQLPWPTGQQHHQNDGFSYGCGDHTGRDYYAIDFALQYAPVSAVASGIAYTGYDGLTTSYGMYIVIDHGAGIISLYGHLSRFLVQDGQHVSQGQEIAISGNTGNSSGPHLHFVIRSGASTHTQYAGTSFKPEPMSGYTGFGNYGTHNPPACNVVTYSPYYKSEPPTQTLSYSVVSATAYTDSGLSQTEDLGHLWPSETGWVVVKAMNTGSATWSNSGSTPVDLGTWGPQDRSSRYYVSGSWVSASRPAGLVESSVAPGQVGTFQFPIQVPSGYGAFDEQFNLVQENVVWFPYAGIDFPTVEVQPDTPVVGNWDGSDLAAGRWLLRNTNTVGSPDVSVYYGGPGDIPVAGKWTATQTGASMSVVRPESDGLLHWLLRYSNTPGGAQTQFSYGLSTDIPVVGDWNGDGVSTIGVVRRGTDGYWHWLLRNSNTPGSPDIQFTYGLATDTPVVGDWNGDRTTTIGVARQVSGYWEWLLRDENTVGNPDVTVAQYGLSTDMPIVGDWNGDHTTTIGVARSVGGLWQWLLRDSNTAGSPDVTVSQYGLSTDVPVVGDWNGDGTATVGVYRPDPPPNSRFTVGVARQVGGYWHWLLRNLNTPGSPDVQFSYGLATDTPLNGDWNGDGVTSVGVARQVGGYWHWLLRNENSPGNPDVTVAQYGLSTDIPIVGDWNGDGTTTIGVVRAVNGRWQWLLRNVNTPGSPSITFTFGSTSGVPVAGDWNGAG